MKARKNIGSRRDGGSPKEKKEERGTEDRKSIGSRRGGMKAGGNKGTGRFGSRRKYCI
jgi:hypothetical protein